MTRRRLFLTGLTLLLVWQLLSEPVFISLFIKDESFTVEVADTDPKKALGLMFRKGIPDNFGMLFPYTGEDYRAMWMKNTLISLDLIFLNARKEIVEIIVNVPPCMEEPCKSYISQNKAQYVLELRGNRSVELDLHPGDTLFFIL